MTKLCERPGRFFNTISGLTKTTVTRKQHSLLYYREHCLCCYVILVRPHYAAVDSVCLFLFTYVLYIHAAAHKAQFYGRVENCDVFEPQVPHANYVLEQLVNWLAC